MYFLVQVVVVLVSTLVWSVAGFAGPIPHIVGGRNASIQEFPHQVTVHWHGAIFCGGGSIISKNAILTAAHIFTRWGDSHGPSYRIRVGSSFRRDDGKLFDVENLVTHPDFDDVALEYDVAIALLAVPIDFDNMKYPAAPVKLGVERPQVGENLIVIGFGRTRFDNEASLSNVLQAAEIPLRDGSVCGFDDESHLKDDATQLCAGTDEKGPFHGDSGGPLINGKHEIVGIVSGAQKGKRVAIFVNVACPSINKFICQYTQQPKPE